jgi:hypothetical protein
MALYKPPKYDDMVYQIFTCVVYLMKKGGAMDAVKKTIVILIMVCSLPAAGFCDTPRAASDEAGMHSLLNAYSALADEHLGSVLRGLRLLASTTEVESGRWETMQGLLARFDKSGIAAAAVWYALPDGRYYSVEKGLTGESLADRPYFRELAAGKEVVGELVISRSTGKRSAVFAVPVMRDGKMAGALGVSLSVDELSGLLNKKMGLPPDFVFYALDTKGRVSLHGKPELLFAYPSDLGSKTLDVAVKKMMSEKEGVVRYNFQGQKTVYFKKSPLTGWVYALGVITRK